MSVKVVTDFRVLMRYALALGVARQNGNLAEIELAQNEHDAYRDLCLKSDVMTLGLRHGDL